MSVDVLIALIGGFAMVLAALVAQGRALGRVRRDTTEVRNQVQNTHRTNFRDDHDALAANVDLVLKSQEALVVRLDEFASDTRATTGRIDRRITALTTRLDKHIDRGTDPA